jgi:ribonuclease E
MQQHLPGTPGEGGGRRRRRRRRRGRRGQGNADNAQQFGAQPSLQEHNSTWDDRFGAGDEIDTTPRDDRVTAPNSSSAPEWSLGADTPPPTAMSEPIESVPDAPARHAESEPAQLEQKSAEPAQPAKKGWWQRAFRSE